MKVGIVSYNFYGGYVNYGAVLQSFALQKALDKLGIENVIVDYVPEHFRGINMGIPVRYMMKEGNGALRRWFFNCIPFYLVDKKFKQFINSNCKTTSKVYTKDNFNELTFDNYVCGSDTIWSIWESKGFDDGFWGNYDCMRHAHCVAYSPSFADVVFTPEEEKVLVQRLQNFSAIGLREPVYLDFVRANTEVPVEWTLDPTLLLRKVDYLPITAVKKQKKPFLLLYSRSRDEKITAFADRIAKERGLKVIEISLQWQHFYKHKMAYDTGIDEFLSLIRDADCIVTNSFHGTIFSILYEKDFYTFTRPNCNGKIEYLLERVGLSSRLYSEDNAPLDKPIDYVEVEERLNVERERSYSFLKNAFLLEN